MDFRIKCALQHIFSIMPKGERLNYFFQKNVTRNLPVTNAEFLIKVDEAYRHFQNYLQFNHLQNRLENYYEFGVGWDFISPLTMSLMGFKKMHCIDIVRLTNDELIKVSIKNFNTNRNNLPFKGEKPIKINENTDIFEQLKTDFGINYSAPADAKNCALQNENVDFISSSSTFEHIPAKDIPGILSECYRILKKGGVFSITINYRDHWEQADKNISVYNFLKYSAEEWKIYNPKLQFQNRLRHKDYINFINESGFKIVKEVKALPTANERNSLNKLKIHKHFLEHYDMEELAVKGAELVLVKN